MKSIMNARYNELIVQTSRLFSNISLLSQPLESFRNLQYTLSF